MDIVVVDDLYRQPLGKPYLTLATDVATRRVLGFVISFMPPGASTVSLCLTFIEGDALHALLTNLPDALDPCDLPWRIAPEAPPEIAQRERGVGDAAGELARALQQADAARGVIALDDVHHIADARVFTFFEALLQWLPERWTLAMTTGVPRGAAALRR
jgi:hypothetical protein